MENKVNNENEITLYDEDGNEYLYNILFTYENEERNTTYVFIYDNESPDDVYPFKYDENGNIAPVEDEEELKECEEVFNAFNDDPKINEIK